MDEAYWNARFERLNGDFISQIMKIEGMNNPSDSEKIQWAEELKDIGNGYFKRLDFEAAILVYEIILDILIPDIPLDEDEYFPFHKLLISCFLNMAACHLKLGNFNEVISLCDRILMFDGNNAKAYYRRAQSYSHIGNFSAAVEDLERAQKLEPHDRKIRLELDLLFDKIRKPKGDTKDKGKQIVWEVSDNGCSFYNVHDIPSPNLGNGTSSTQPNYVNMHNLEAGNDLVQKRSEAFWDEEVKQDPRRGWEAPLYYGAGCDSNNIANENDSSVGVEKDTSSLTDGLKGVVIPPVDGGQCEIDSGSPTKVEAQIAKVDFQQCYGFVNQKREGENERTEVSRGSEMVTDQESVTDAPSHMQGVTQRMCKEKGGTLHFVNKKRPSSSLRLSSRDMEKLIMGKDLQFNHPKLGCVMRVRALTLKNSIMTETLHDTCSWEAVVSNDTNASPIEVEKENPSLQDNVDSLMGVKTSSLGGTSSVDQGATGCTVVFSSSERSPLPQTVQSVSKERLSSCCAIVGNKRKLAQNPLQKDIICMRNKYSGSQPTIVFSVGWFHNHISERMTKMRLLQRHPLIRKTTGNRRMTNQLRSCKLSIGLKRKAMVRASSDKFVFRKKQCCRNCSSNLSFDGNVNVTSCSDFGRLGSSCTQG